MGEAGSRVKPALLPNASMPWRVVKRTCGSSRSTQEHPSHQQPHPPTRPPTQLTAAASLQLALQLLHVHQGCQALPVLKQAAQHAGVQLLEGATVAQALQQQAVGGQLLVQLVAHSGAGPSCVDLGKGIQHMAAELGHCVLAPQATVGAQPDGEAGNERGRGGSFSRGLPGGVGAAVVTLVLVPAAIATTSGDRNNIRRLPGLPQGVLERPQAEGKLTEPGAGQGSSAEGCPGTLP